MRDVRGSRRPLRLLQVGMGDWGRDWAWRVIPGIRSVKLVGCVDLDPKALALTRVEVAIPAERCFTSLDAALEATNPDAVLVTTLLPGHVPVARAALEAGKHVLVEKPFANRTADARMLVELAAKRELVLMVSQNYRFFPAVRKVAGLIAEGRLGELGQVWVDFRRYSPVRPSAPRSHHTYDEPLLVDMSIHHFDLMRYVLTKEAKSVSCYSWNPNWSGFSGPPTAVATIVFAGDLVVSYRGSWISAGPSTPWAGEWRMEFEGGEIMWTSRGDDARLADVVVVKRHGQPPKALAMPAIRRIDRWGTLAEFADAVRRNREPQSSGHDNLRTLALVDAAVESAKLRRPVNVRMPR